MIRLMILVLLCGSVTEGSHILIYNGPGTCTEGCSDAAAKILTDRGYSPTYLTPSRITKTRLATAKLWVQPGGDAIEMANSLSSVQKNLLRRFVAEGGTYLGICAGAFLADRTVDDSDQVEGLGFLAGTTYDLLPQFLGKALMLPVFWGMQLRQIYFEDGPGFRMLPQADYQTIANYQDGTPAVIHFKYGKGTVVLSGVHPESPTFWKEFHRLNDPDGDDFDLAHQLLDIVFAP